MEHKAIVSISGKKGPFENVKNALAALDLTPLKGKRVMIKPNIGRAAKAFLTFLNGPFLPEILTIAL